MNHLGISGGGTKIAGLFGATEVLMKEKGYKPDVISGISAGAILSVPLALGKFDQIKELVLKAKLSDFFSKPPVKQDGSFKLGAILRAISGKPYLGMQGNLEKTLAKVVSKQEFEAYKKDPNAPSCVVGTVNFKDAGRWYFDLKNDPLIDHAMFLKLVNASASLPIFTNGIEVKYDNQWLYLYDGGVRDHCPTAYMLERHPDYKDKISQTISIYSRPDQPEPEPFSDKNLITVLSSFVNITNIEVSKTDQWQELRLAKDKNIPIMQVFMPQIMRKVYDTDPSRLYELYQKARAEAEKKYPGNINFTT